MCGGLARLAAESQNLTWGGKMKVKEAVHIWIHQTFSSPVDSRLALNVSSCVLSDFLWSDLTSIRN